MKRNNRYISGRGVRYYQYSSGVVAGKRSKFLTVVLPVFIVLGMCGGGGFAGYKMYMSKPGVLQAATPTDNLPAPVVEETTDPLVPKAIQLREDDKLADQINDLVHKMPKQGTWSVSVRDLNTGRMANINADQQMESASLYKLFLLPPLEKKISADNWKSRLGKQTINDCVVAMIKVSDNACPPELGSYIGWKGVNPYNASIGFTKTKIDEKNGNITNAREVSEMMYRLQNSQILSDKGRRVVFDALYAQKHRKGIPKGCGSECLVANKTGEIDNVKHDAAIVTHDTARYVVVIMSKDSSWDQVADLARQIDEVMLP